MDPGKRTHKTVYLAYSSDGQKESGARMTAFSREWKQLELFASASPEVLVFIRPDESDLAKTLISLNVRHIVDIREVPYLTFKGCDRNHFFDSITESSIDYLGMHELMHRQGVDSTSPLFETDAEGGLHRGDRLKRELESRIGHGPTMVFCDLDPKVDDKVGRLLDFLTKRSIKHSPVLAVDA